MLAQLPLLSVVAVACCVAVTVDLSYDLNPNSPTWGTNKLFKKTTAFKGLWEGKLWVEMNNLEFNEHTSTHMDAPNHFGQGKRSVDQIPFEDFTAPVVVMDISEKAAKDPNAVLTGQDFLDWTKTYGDIPAGAVLFLYTGQGAKYGDLNVYFGGNFTDPSTYNFPGFSIEAARNITGYKNKIVGVGLDTPSLDPGNSKTFPAHVEFAENNLYGIENVANLHLLPPTGAEVVLLPLKIREGTGGPTRILARLPDPPRPIATALTAEEPMDAGVSCQRSNAMGVALSLLVAGVAGMRR